MDTDTNWLMKAYTAESAQEIKQRLDEQQKPYVMHQFESVWLFHSPAGGCNSNTCHLAVHTLIKDTIYD